MKIDHSTLQKVAVELKTLVKLFLKRKQQGKLWEFLKVYTPKEREYLLSLFDRYGLNVEYEKSGLRIVNNNGDIQAFKFGYKSEESAKDSNNSAYTKIRLSHLNEIKKVKLNESLITYPSTKELIESVSVIYAMRIFKRSFEECLIYAKVKSLKPIMDKISEYGINDEFCKSLNDIFRGLTQEGRNKILALFDCQYPSSEFKGIRYVTVGARNYVPIDRRNNVTRFKFNSLHLRKTVDIIEEWKKL